MSFVLIPEVVDSNKELHPNSKRLCGYIISLSNAKFGCIASNKYFAERLGVSIPTVNRYLQELKQHEYIEVDFVERKNSIQGQQRIITPTSNVLITMKQAKENEQKREYEPDWLEDYMKSF